MILQIADLLTKIGFVGTLNLSLCFLQKRDAVPVDDEAVVTSNKTKTNEKPSTPIIEVERVSQLNKKLDKKKVKETSIRFLVRSILFAAF